MNETEKSAPEKEATPLTITICGSTKFADLMAVISWEFEKIGVIVLRVNYLPDWYVKKQKWTESSHGAEQSGVKVILDELHCRKIDLSDEVYVCNANGYIGESTRNEINYALSKNKPITYMEGEGSMTELGQYMNDLINETPKGLFHIDEVEQEGQSELWAKAQTKVEGYLKGPYFAEMPTPTAFDIINVLKEGLLISRR